MVNEDDFRKYKIFYDEHYTKIEEEAAMKVSQIKEDLDKDDREQMKSGVVETISI